MRIELIYLEPQSSALPLSYHQRQVDPEGGFEPKPFTVPKTVVLPLDDSGMFN